MMTMPRFDPALPGTAPDTGIRPPLPPDAGHTRTTAADAAPQAAPATGQVVGGAAWRAGLPVLTGTKLTLRELRPEDAPSLFSYLTTEEVARFITPPPTTVDGFARFIAWARQRRAQGRYACFAVVPHGTDTAVGLFQIHMDPTDPHVAEWGFALGSAHWGTGLFVDGARLVLDFAFATLGLRRLEARACLANGRGSGALHKVGAVRERVLPRSFERHGEVLDQGLWTILREDYEWLVVTEGGNRTH